MRLLFTNAGRRTYMVEFALALKRQGALDAVYLSDCDPYAAALHVSPETATVMTPPVLADPARYVDAVLDAVRANGIGLVIPLSDLELQPLAEAAAAFEKAGARVVVARPDVARACMDKRGFAEFCRRNDLPSPEIYDSAADAELPCIRKRILGSGSQGLSIARAADQLAGFDPATELLQRFVDGPEYGIDVLNDFAGDCVAVCVKRKLGMRAGETDRAVVVDAPELVALARRVATATRHVGNLDLDVIVDAGGAPHLIDANPRFGGGYPATHLAGLDYLAAIVGMAAGKRPTLPARPKKIVVMKGISLFACEAQP